MQCSSSLHSYPHINQCNIPDIFELQRTRETINRIERQLQDVRPKLQDAYRRLDNLHRSYKDEGASYAQSKSYIKQFPKLQFHEGALLQEAAVLKSLRSPVHPIRRCPTDILRLIFEWILIDHPDPCAKRLWPATLLSQVCYRWRGIALCMPQLWTYLDISLNRSADDIEAYWSRTIERVRMCPVVIHIKDLTLSDETRAAMEKCRLNLIPRIQFLVFSFDQVGALGALRTCHFHPPTSEIDTLDIQANCDNPYFFPLSNLSDPGSSPSLSDPLQFLGWFSAFKRLKLTGFDLLSHTVGFMIPHVAHLSLTNCENVALNVLSKTFPDVENVMFVNCRPFSHHGEDIKWDRVTRLQVDISDGLPWERLNLPQIQSISLLISEITQVVSPVFLRSHPSLQEFHCINLFNGFSDIAKAAPQLTKISMPASEAKWALQFHNLDCLYLYIFQHFRSGLETDVLEAIIEQHFPPSTKLERQTDSLATNPLDNYGVTGGTLSVFMPINSMSDHIWRVSPAMLRKEERITKATVWTQEYNVYSYI